MDEQTFFLSAGLKLLAFSAVASLIILVIWKIGKLILTVCGSSPNEDGGDELGCGCLCFVGISILCGIVSFAVDKYDEILNAYLSDSTTQAIKADHENGPISIFRKEHGLLYNHYEKLQSTIRRNQETCDTLQQELQTMSSERGRKTLAKRIDELNSENKTHQLMVDNIEELAGKYYFARMMDNLGLRVNQEQLNVEIGIMKMTAEKNN